MAELNGSPAPSFTMSGHMRAGTPVQPLTPDESSDSDNRATPSPPRRNGRQSRTESLACTTITADSGYATLSHNVTQQNRMGTIVEAAETASKLSSTGMPGPVAMIVTPPTMIEKPGVVAVSLSNNHPFLELRRKWCWSIDGTFAALPDVTVMPNRRLNLQQTADQTQQDRPDCKLGGLVLYALTWPDGQELSGHPHVAVGWRVCQGAASSASIADATFFVRILERSITSSDGDQPETQPSYQQMLGRRARLVTVTRTLTWDTMKKRWRKLPEPMIGGFVKMLKRAMSWVTDELKDAEIRMLVQRHLEKIVIRINRMLKKQPVPLTGKTTMQRQRENPFTMVAINSAMEKVLGVELERTMELSRTLAQEKKRLEEAKAKRNHYNEAARLRQQQSQVLQDISLHAVLKYQPAVKVQIDDTAVTAQHQDAKITAPVYHPEDDPDLMRIMPRLKSQLETLEQQTSTNTKLLRSISNAERALFNMLDATGLLNTVLDTMEHDDDELW
ncbi:hypothetical protein THASP1DRAFT_33596 [Thamnocephalis sphaerospora]|uniref:Uncharacterized protein n=1 Tax=Thamnocephalis sphaerospora TaxID=78915 RepID=A0A4P9XG73_9FUNG|nr:hypothetical protein THASP1DRAFT_33596 [Thamnocephalis sphaerospora]|eukprot:RKP04616.1 hypothetical protein THASP1DRAFT_33596 [Thamnocephalis sphaerospora]